MSFDHRDDGTSEASWLAVAQWSRVPELDLSGVRRLVVVAAHPDDESLGAGGLMARASALGLPVRVVVATSGEASHPNSLTTTRAGLALARRSELLKAVEIVAPSALVDTIGLPDGALTAHIDTLAAHLDSLRLGEGTLVVAPWRRDGHPDHAAAGEAAATSTARSGARLLEYPIWLWHWGQPVDAPWSSFVMLGLDEDERAAKLAAIECHESQNAALSEKSGDETLLSVAFRAHFGRLFEVFITATETPAAAETLTLTRDYFDEFYSGADDPWGFESRWYESRKRSLTVASLPRPAFVSALEIGCSIGMLTAELADRCERLVATDIAERPLVTARKRLAHRGHVEFVHAESPLELPDGVFDLIVLSEVAYYWSADDLRTAIDRIDRVLAVDGVLVACHWRHPVAGYPERGDDVHATLRAYSGFAVLAEHREEDFLLDVLVRPPARSVAADTGLI